MSLINIILSALSIVVCCLYFGKEMSGNKIEYKNVYFVIAIIVFAVIIGIISYIIEDYYKIFINYLAIGCLYKFLFNGSINKSFSMSLITIVFFFISEIFFSIAFQIYLTITATPFDPSLKGSALLNIIISLIAILIFGAKVSKNLVNKVMTLLIKIQSPALFFAVIFAIGIFGLKNVSFLGTSTSYIMNLILILIFATILFYLYREKENSKQLSDKYDQLLNYMQKYEVELTERNMTIHEFKNQIISIKSLAKPQNKDLLDYIDSILGEIKNIEYNGIKDMRLIPEGGLRGLIYYKLGDLNTKGIKVKTMIDSKLKKTFFCAKNTVEYKDILKVIGVYLDNAIEAVGTAAKKEIILEMYYLKQELHFILSNTYNGSINPNNLGNLGYSTKGKGRGYGLNLVNKIINSYDNLNQLRFIDENYYTVHFVISHKKSSSCS